MDAVERLTEQYLSDLRSIRCKKEEDARWKRCSRCGHNRLWHSSMAGSLGCGSYDPKFPQYEDPQGEKP
jgi:hypothetical protein